MPPTNPKRTPPAKPSAESSQRNAAPPIPTEEPIAPVEAPPPQPELADPSKLRSIPELDLYLFNVGEHRRAHRILGAHLVDGGVRFAVWAPNAQRVSVVGNFNGWNRDAHPMERRASTGVWERFIPDLGHGFYYKFAVQKANGRWEFRGDPFALSLIHI